jgi:hypothetical protein
MGKACGVHGNEANVYIVLARERTGMTYIIVPNFGRKDNIKNGP